MLPINELQLATMRAKFVGISNAQHRQTNLCYFKIYTSDNYRNHPTYLTTTTGNNEKKKTTTLNLRYLRIGSAKSVF